jgi:chromosome segregation ATPase
MSAAYAMLRMTSTLLGNRVGGAMADNRAAAQEEHYEIRRLRQTLAEREDRLADVERDLDAICAELVEFHHGYLTSVGALLVELDKTLADRLQRIAETPSAMETALQASDRADAKARASAEELAARFTILLVQPAGSNPRRQAKALLAMDIECAPAGHKQAPRLLRSAD